jgi:hypothetical protein
VIGFLSCHELSGAFAKIFFLFIITLPFSYFKSSHYESLQKTASDFSKNAKQA